MIETWTAPNRAPGRVETPIASRFHVWSNPMLKLCAAAALDGCGRIAEP